MTAADYAYAPFKDSDRTGMCLTEKENAYLEILRSLLEPNSPNFTRKNTYAICICSRPANVL
ncbi:MAG: hypothetical protein RM368_17965 [Nostoc sp. DedSLP03]|uniref:hypothetical protein n=1 Tax=Nostoc sp. DedSLP03 TaxID=3075400 RepID=UPI002AD4FEE0|nr:hypothetical protein [Nostoc sp. DedSLP03]MDZ7966836.1 hypothetical protein [Nostoc sp. DedSLP03]